MSMDLALFYTIGVGSGGGGRGEEERKRGGEVERWRSREERWRVERTESPRFIWVVEWALVIHASSKPISVRPRAPQKLSSPSVGVFPA